MAGYTLYGRPGSGSMIVEAAFALAGVALDHVTLEWEDLGWDSTPLQGLNPLGQLPTLILPDGSVMTETAAIIQHVADHHPAAGLVPDLVIITGDLAFSGKSEEYGLAQAWLDAKLWPALNAGRSEPLPHDRLLLVPGNPGLGCIGTIALGMIGSLVGGTTLNALTGDGFELAGSGFFGSVFGAVLVLVIARLFRGDSRTRSNYR